MQFRNFVLTLYCQTIKKIRTMSTKENIFEGSIKLTDRFYVKPCDTARERFDLYELKETKSKHNELGKKLDDFAYGLTIEEAIKKVIIIEGEENTKDLKELLRKMQEMFEKIKNNIIVYLN